MGACMSSGGVEVSEEDKRRNKEVEKELKEAKAKLASQVKVLLLGSGDSGKSTILKQMRLIHKVPFTPQEVESYRQLVFNNLTHGLQSVLEAMDDMDLQVSEENQQYIEMIESAADIKDHEPFPQSYYEPLKSLWADENLQKAYSRGNEAALPENLEYFFPQLDRLFKPDYQPHELDIVHCRARTIGITETMFQLKDHEMLMVDVGGQKSERRKWIHCFQDVTSILFLVSLSGYDQCLVEDKDANQMQDAMTIWDSICHSQWFKQTSIILFLNKNDLFEKKIAHSDIKNYFPDYDGEPGDVRAGREYFKKRFARLAQKAGAKEREIYIHLTTATDTAMLRVVMAAVEGSITLRSNLENAALI
ncbi:heterotrimeric G-protein alpha subunit, GPA2-like protein [Gloeophyllum trabeum ATCC 11539]|uniref:Heterotrimeric G-protein alpha subunit, GPA2-like protein n=1 Tax=Gloeophyllum trabeum (strain ATCC 11539 / FP-39264 / Madison 617) TaxID=670483 RepID=S7QP33_GLOTA|nr:heterotrimeric G-protein alpha subunit, GPA2-like protein [Gloeophyllum trabeum ATCC 11539]EPQ61288.1 heterotrimeric G-protein alpha subunit, GPA2-like protein [Gloeophyllum trabeum ATCC 11539]